MVASITDKFRKTFNSGNPEVTFVTSTRSALGTTLACDNLAGWPTSADTPVDFVTYRLDTDGETPVVGTQIDWKGIVSGSNITNLTRVAGAADTGSQVNDVVEAMPTGTWANDLITGILVSHDQDGTLKDSIVTTAKINNDAVTNAKLAAGVAVQHVGTNYSAVATGTTLIPTDDTIPQITEGNEFMTQTITPKSATNTLFIEAEMYLSAAAVADVTAAIFQDATANALAAKVVFQSANNAAVTLRVTHRMVAGTTSPITFRVRAGYASAGTITFCGQSGARRYGGVTTSTIKITEYKA